MLSSSSQMYVGKSMFDVSIIIPVYNCAEKIDLLLDSIKGSLEQWSGTYELIIVNDGSTDNTLRLLEDRYALDPKVRIFSYPVNKGKGHAVKTGILACVGSKCLFIDGDMDILPKGIQTYFKELEECDMVVASKRHKFSKVACSTSRKFLSFAFNIFVRLTTGISVRDTQSGLKAGDSILLKEIFSSMIVSRYAFDVELLVLAKKAGLAVREMPVELSVRSKFKVSEIINMSCDVLRIAYRHRIKQLAS